MKRAARSSSSPPISPIMTTASVSGVVLEAPQDVDEAGPDHRVAADPTQVVWPTPAAAISYMTW
jgi:hypothetical protein